MLGGVHWFFVRRIVWTLWWSKCVRDIGLYRFLCRNIVAVLFFLFCVWVCVSVCFFFRFFFFCVFTRAQYPNIRRRRQQWLSVSVCTTVDYESLTKKSFPRLLIGVWINERLVYRRKKNVLDCCFCCFLLQFLLVFLFLFLLFFLTKAKPGV